MKPPELTLEEYAVPMIKVTWMAGRTPAQKQAVAARITDALCEESGVTPEQCWIVFHDVASTDWAAGGTLVGDSYRVP